MKLSHNRGCIRQKGYVSGALDGYRQHTLMFGAVPGNASRRDFAPFGRKVFQYFNIFVVDFQAAVRTKAADFPAVIDSSFSMSTASS